MKELSLSIPGAPIAKKRCYRCRETKDISEFSRNRSKKDGAHDECKLCTSISNKKFLIKHHEKRKAAQKEAYRKNLFVSRQKSKENYYNNREKVLARQRETRRSNNELLYSGIGGAFCRLCGFDEYLSSLQLHHLNRDQKDSHKDVLSNWVKLPKKEKFIEKLRSVEFTVLCANCHVALHTGELDESILVPLEIVL